jgi:hypothetical protein
VAQLLLLRHDAVRLSEVCPWSTRVIEVFRGWIEPAKTRKARIGRYVQEGRCVNKVTRNSYCHMRSVRTGGSRRSRQDFKPRLTHRTYCKPLAPPGSSSAARNAFKILSLLKNACQSTDQMCNVVRTSQSRRSAQFTFLTETYETPNLSFRAVQ